MQKTTLFGKGHDSSHTQAAKQCASCMKLRIKVSQLTQLLSDSQASLQSALGGSDNELLRQLQGELLSLREKYAALKKRVQQAEKENDELFADNTRIEKQLVHCRTQLRDYEEGAKATLPAQANEGSVGEQGRVWERKAKEREVETFVWQQRVRQLQLLGKEQGEEIACLKELLRRRNTQQTQRHQLLQLIT